MKALFVLGNYNRGGAERQAVYLARWLKTQCGIQVEFFAFSGKGPISEELEREGIQCSTVPFNFFFIDAFRRPGINRKSLSYYLKLRNEAKRYAEAIQATGADIVLPFTYYPNVVCGLSWKRSDAKLCVWNQRDIGNDGMTGNYAEQSAVRKTPAFVSNSQQGADLLITHSGVSARMIRVIPNGIVIPPVQSGNHSDFGLDAMYQHVVMLANFHPFKDHATLVRAWKIVVSELRDQPLRLVLAGRFGGTEKELMKMSEELGVRGSIVFLDSVADVNGLLGICTISAFSSVKEGNPNAVLEAMASGLAVAATRIPGCMDALGQDYAYLSEPGDEQGMASNIIALLRSAELRTKVGNRNRARIETSFSIERMGEQYLQVFREHGLSLPR